MRSRSWSGLGYVAVLVLIIAILIGIGAVITNSRPNSTQGVAEVEPKPGLVSLPVGDTAVFTEYVSKYTTYVWSVTYDGESTVTFTRNRAFKGVEQKTATMVGGQRTELDFGVFRHTLYFVVSDDKDYVLIKYPYTVLGGWHLRPYEG